MQLTLLPPPPPTFFSPCPFPHSVPTAQMFAQKMAKSVVAKQPTSCHQIANDSSWSRSDTTPALGRLADNSCHAMACMHVEESPIRLHML